MCEDGETKRRLVDMAAMRDLSATTSLMDVRLASFGAQATRPVSETIDELDQILKYRAGVLDVQEEALVGWVEFIFTVVLGEEELFTITGTYVVIYQPFQDQRIGAYDDNKLQQYVEVMGVLNAWPYLREFVCSAASRLGVSGVTLPTWRIPSELPPEGEYARIERRVAEAESGGEG